MQIVRKKLTAAEVGGATTRYDPTCDCVQISPDGGTTWNDAPGLDPRTQTGGLLPSRSTGEPRCDSAESAMQHYKAAIDAFLASADAFAFASAYLGLLLFIPGIDALWALLVSIGLALLETTKTVVATNMTTAFYDDLRCILFQNMDGSGQLTDAALAQVYSDVASQESSAASDIFALVTGAWGIVGFNNAAASGEYSGDCSACAIACDFSVNFETGGYSDYTLSHGALVESGTYHSATHAMEGDGAYSDPFGPATEGQINIALPGNMEEVQSVSFWIMRSSSDGMVLDAALLNGSGGVTHSLIAGLASPSGWTQYSYFGLSVTDAVSLRIYFRIGGAAHANHVFLDDVAFAGICSG